MASPEMGDSFTTRTVLSNTLLCVNYQCDNVLGGRFALETPVLRPNLTKLPSSLRYSCIDRSSHFKTFQIVGPMFGNGGMAIAEIARSRQAWRDQARAALAAAQP